ncbi:flagellar export chaperone FlgN [Microbacterium sp. ASV49]|uniref:Flagellar export chaperone FlgN n=2 Tax=Microbacterium candidum TaxID=3041922 RepID=A0ABT7MTT4_9MICO|nr:flagellar export chaperone FlgN [Microbacterium sp. ASV49]MDL9977857.1 flagellar export chaperone FlgN [Microbacterium sp. ASV49]
MGLSAHELSMQLMRERDLLELMLFKLEEQQMLLATGRNRWIKHAADELGRVAAAMPAAAMKRDGLAAAVAVEWGVPDGTTLRDLIDVAPTDAWREVLQGHLTVMTGLADEILEMKKINEQRLRTALRVTQETIAGLGVPTGEYDLAGGVVRGGRSQLLDTRA